MKTDREVTAYRLKQLVIAAGGTNSLAKILGLEASTVRKWVHAEHISLSGALLVGASTFLSIFVKADGSRYFRASSMRPDVPPYMWRIHSRNLRRFRLAREKQTEVEVLGGSLLGTYDGEPMTPEAVSDFLKAVSAPDGSNDSLDPYFAVFVKKDE